MISHLTCKDIQFNWLTFLTVKGRSRTRLRPYFITKIVNEIEIYIRKTSSQIRVPLKISNLNVCG